MNNGPDMCLCWNVKEARTTVVARIRGKEKGSWLKRLCRLTEGEGVAVAHGTRNPQEKSIYRGGICSSTLTIRILHFS